MLKSFILGMCEFRSDVTTSASDMLAYDWGREIMHRITLRHFEQ